MVTARPEPRSQENTKKGPATSDRRRALLRAGCVIAQRTLNCSTSILSWSDNWDSSWALS